ncbi:NB-ARC domain-containing protein [Aerosakkonemataceae cyanobacterium BLCC-F50]|uniref:NB-ARC domain-containing protein n=1 Tax=Floridaenema flaviceps BLCC-F50 TaxID=3153642 RepID=A0ABV4Y0S6_9CYAN
MAGLLRGSEEGLKIIDLVRRNLGWNKVDDLWCQAALTSKATLKRFWARQPIRRETFIDICKAVGVKNWQDIVEREIKEPELLLASAIADLPILCEKNTNFALPENLPPVRNWVGSTREIEAIKKHLFNPNIIGISIIGLPGIGKSTLASQLVRQLQGETTPFVAAAWQTLQTSGDIPPNFVVFIDSLFSVLSHTDTTIALSKPNDCHQKIEQFIKLVKEKPYLIVFDSVETILKTGLAQTAGYFDETYTEYAWLFKQLLDTEHQSKLLFISRESLAELPPTVTREIVLTGLDRDTGIALLQSFNLTDTPQELEPNLPNSFPSPKGGEVSELAELSDRYQGHPKALQLIANLICNNEEYQGNVGKFLQDRDWLLIQEIDNFLEQIFQRLSELERNCISRLSVYRTSEFNLNYNAIAAQMPEVSRYELKENILRALKRRQLLYYHPVKQCYQIHPIIQEKAYRILSQNYEHLLKAHRQAYHYFLKFPLKPETEWQNIEDIKPLIQAHYHACQAEDWEQAAQIVSGVCEYLRQWGYQVDQNAICFLGNISETLVSDTQTQQILGSKPSTFD